MNDCDVCDLSYEPMDVDVSNTSGNNVDTDLSKNSAKPNVTIKKEVITDEEDNNMSSKVIYKEETHEHKPKEQVIQTIKKYHIKMNRENKTNTQMKMILLIILSILIAIATYYVINFNCSHNLDVKEIKKSLIRNVYGQPKAINKIIETLSYNASSKILFFYGGTGVGKTYTASLILGGHWNSSNIYHYTMPGFVNTFSTDLMVGLTICKTSMLVVDDLTQNDMHINTHISNFIMKSEGLNKNVTIILIFNCDTTNREFSKKCDNSFYDDLKSSFSSINAIKKYVKFEPLTEEHLKMCIEKELGKRVVNRLDMEKILKNFNVSLDGCKGVYTKMKYLNAVLR